MASSILNSDDGVISGTSGLKSTGGDDGVLVFQSKGTETARITTAGNVGVGVVPEAWTVFKVVQINEQAAVGGTSASSQLLLNSYYDGSYKFIGTGYAQRYYQSAGDHVWETSSASGSADGAITFTEQAKITSAGLFQFNSGYGSAAAAYGCRAWVNFNGTGTPAIREDGNVSSITDNGVGDYTLNFTTAMPDGNYCVVGTTSSSVAQPASSITAAFAAPHEAIPTTTAIRVLCYAGNSAFDSTQINVAIFR